MALEQDSHLVCDARAAVALLHQAQQIVGVLHQEAILVHLEHGCFIPKGLQWEEVGYGQESRGTII